GYRPGGTLAVARDADDNAALEDLYRFQLRCGLEVERLRSRECRQLEPGLHPGIRGGVLAAGDHQADNRALVEALVVACERAGVGLVAGRVAELAVEGDRVTGVVLGDGERLPAAAVALAAGCRGGVRRRGRRGGAGGRAGPRAPAAGRPGQGPAALPARPGRPAAVLPQRARA